MFCSESNDCINFIIWLMIFSEKINIFYMIPCISINCNLSNKLKIIENSPPIIDYTIVYSLMNIHDNSYITNKMPIFKKEVQTYLGKIGNDQDSLINFCKSLKKNILLELFYIYHRFRLYPSEALLLQKEQSKHPFFKIQKLLEEEYVCKIKLENIYEIIFRNDNVELLKDYLKKRHLFLSPMYRAFLHTKNEKIKPLFHSNNNYYPMKIFSAEIFIMEHLLQSN
uniref:Uncharacterized protein n=1 Tax=viral metagenome TaxID=1070528 RepID=A0A6C0LQS0_9ZZZZ